MYSVTLSEQQQKDLAKSLVSFLSRYKHISDAYIIEFFSENLWETLPEGWRKALQDLSPPQIADLLLERETKNKVYPSVWPLSLLALRATAHTLAFPRMSPDHLSKDTVKPDEFHSISSQSSLLGHIFRKHVKPKKQHEIHKLGMLVKQLCDETQCNSVIDVGSGQGHLTRFLSFGLGLNVTAVEADPRLASMATKFDEELLSTLAKENHKAGTLDSVPQHTVGWVNPGDSWETFLQKLGKWAKNCESYPGTVEVCKKRPLVSMTSGKECELVCGSQHLCTGQSCLVAYAAENPASSIPEQQEVGSNGCVALSDTVMADCCPQAGCEWTSPMYPEGCSNEKEPMCLDFVLTGLHACGDLSATLLRHFANCPYVRGITSVACCYMKISTKDNPKPPGVILPSLPDNMYKVLQSKSRNTVEYGYPMSEWVRQLPGHELSYKAREGACHAIEDYCNRLSAESSLLKIHCYRAALEIIIRAERPQLCRAGIQTIKKAHMLPFAESVSSQHFL